MLRVISVLLLLLFASFNITAQVSVTVYNADLGVVRDERKMNINSGISEIAMTDVAQFIDPTSVHIKLNGEVIEQNYQYDLVSMDKILQKYLDKDIELISEDGELLKGVLLSAFGGQIVLKKTDGGLIMLPNISKYRFSVGELPQGLITKPTLIWKVNSPSSGEQNVEVSYQTSGMKWHAEYVAVLNENDTKTDLNAWVSVENKSGTSYKNANLKLVAGDVNLIKDMLRKGQSPEYEMMQKSMGADEQFAEKEFFEYHIYNLQRKTTLMNNETKQISLFEASDIEVNKKYVYKSGGGYWYNPQGSGKVSVVVEFVNEEKNNLGVPMPKGKVRVYKSDGETIEFIGEDLIDHTPRNEKVRLRIGDAFDIIAEELQTDSKRISNRVSESEWEIKIRNRKKEDITVEVEKWLGLNWEVIRSSIPHKKEDAQRISFSVPVKADGETVLSFRVRYSY